MAGRRLDGQLGDKVGPKLAQLILNYTLAGRRALGPLEARWQQAATQAIIDRAGAEAADLYRPLWDELTRIKGDQLHPIMARHVARVSSGRHQWESLLGHAQMAAAGSLGSVISNLVWPVTSVINLADRNLTVDPQTGANAAAAGLVSLGDAQDNAGKYGYIPDAASLWYELAMSVPDPGTVQDLVNRGLLAEDRALYWLQRGAVPAELREIVLGLRRQLLTPADAALGLLRGDITEADAVAIAAASGMTPADFARLVLNTGEPPGAEQLAEALRRGYIDTARFAEGIRQSRIRDEWIGVLEDLRYSPVPTADAIDASLRGWIGEDLARAIAEQNGVTPGQVQILLDNAGNPPSNEQLLELRRRGYITDDLLVKGIRQGRTRDEWIPQIKLLATEPISTADALDAWLRGHVDDAGLDVLLADNGLLERDWQLAKDNQGNPLAPGQLADALRRGIIGQADAERGFRESRYRDEWLQTWLALLYSPMSTADAVDAVLQDQLDSGAAAAIAAANGLDPGQYQVLEATAGEPLARTELQQLYNRGLIDLDTYRQGLRESRLKNKYVDIATFLHVRLPEAYQVLRWVEYGIVDQDQALAIFGQIGYDQQTACRMIAEGAVTATGPHKELMAGEITRLYSDRIITEQQATEFLEQLHYSDATITLMLQLADYQQKQRILASGIGAIRTHYLAYRITDLQATADLLALNLPAATAALYLQVWGYDRLAHPRQLTEAQLVKAANGNMLVTQGTMDTDDWQAANQQAGCERLVQLGYSPDDARLLLAGA